MLYSIDDGSQEEAKAILSLLTYTPRPLTVAEIVDAIAVDIHDQERFDPDRKLEDSRDIQRLCPGLIEIYEIDDQSDSVIEAVRIAHFSVQEYLQSPRIRQSRAAGFAMSDSNGHFEITKTCLIYLLHNDEFLGQELCPELLNEYAFARFAARYWHYHYKRSDYQSKKTLEQEVKLLLTVEERREKWLRLYNPDRWWDNTVSYTTGTYASSIYYAALLGLDNILESILTASSLEVNAQGGDFGNALQAASWGGPRKDSTDTAR